MRSSKVVEAERTASHRNLCNSSGETWEADEPCGYKEARENKEMSTPIHKLSKIVPSMPYVLFG